MRQEQLRSQSGSVSTQNPVDVLLYMLLKDGTLTPDKLEEVLAAVSKSIPGTAVFNNGWLGQYAINVRMCLDNLVDVTKEQSTEDAIDTLTDNEKELIIAQLKRDEEEEAKRRAHVWEDIDIDLESL